MKRVKLNQVVVLSAVASRISSGTGLTQPNFSVTAEGPGRYLVVIYQPTDIGGPFLGDVEILITKISAALKYSNTRNSLS
jgi:hypothetical protein